LAAIGKTILNCQTVELSPADIRTLGDLITTIGEAINDLAQVADD
jgi:hypothetical protein